MTLHNLDEVLELFTNQEKEGEEEEDEEEDEDEGLEDEEEDSDYGKVSDRMKSEKEESHSSRGERGMCVFMCFCVCLQESWTMRLQRLFMKTEAACWTWTPLPS